MSVNSALLHDMYHLSDKPSDEDWEKLNKRIVRLAVSSEILQRKMIRVTMGWVGLDWIGMDWPLFLLFESNEMKATFKS